MKDLSVFRQFAKESKVTSIDKNGKAVIYTRVSTKEQAENNASLETQKKYCELYAKKKEIEIIEYFGGTYESAKSDERKEFQKMLSFVKRRKKDVSYIIVYSYDRFSRTGANGAFISEQLKKEGIVTLSATQEVDAMTASGSFQQNLYYLFSQFDNELRRDKSVSGMREKLRKGYWIGTVPFGYTNLNPGNGKVQKIVINEKGKLLKKAFEWKAKEDLTYHEISKRLEQRYNLKLNPKRLTCYFRNPFHCGLIVNSLIPGEIVQGKHEQLISKELFLKVNGLLNHRDKGSQYKKEDEQLPLKRFVRSYTCDTPYTGYLVKSKGLYYYKNNRKGSKENKSAKKMHQEFEELLAHYQLQDKKYIAPLKDIMTYTFVAAQKTSIKETENIEKQIGEIRNKLERLEERFVFEEISKDQFDKFRLKLELEKREKEEYLSKSGFEISNLEKAIEYAVDYSLKLPLLWRSGDIETKLRLQKMVFPEGIQYDFENSTYRTTRVNTIFNLIPDIASDLKGNKKETNLKNLDLSRRVESPRIELGSKQVTLLLSTCLVLI